MISHSKLIQKTHDALKLESVENEGIEVIIFLPASDENTEIRTA